MSKLFALVVLVALVAVASAQWVITNGGLVSSGGLIHSGLIAPQWAGVPVVTSGGIPLSSTLLLKK